MKMVTWRTTAPTAEQVRAHIKAHPADGRGRALMMLNNPVEVIAISMPGPPCAVPYGMTDCGVYPLIELVADGRACRLLSADGDPVPWPSAPGEDPSEADIEESEQRVRAEIERYWDSLDYEPIGGGTEAIVAMADAMIEAAKKAGAYSWVPAAHSLKMRALGHVAAAIESAWAAGFMWGYSDASPSGEEPAPLLQPGEWMWLGPWREIKPDWWEREALRCYGSSSVAYSFAMAGAYVHGCSEGWSGSLRTRAATREDAMAGAEKAVRAAWGKEVTRG